MNRGHWKYVPNDAGGVDAVPYENPTIEVNAPQVITDELPSGFRSMADRQFYTSKRKYRDSLKRLGKIEIGNATLDELKITQTKAEKEEYEQQLEDDVRWSRNAVKYNEAPLDELDKERCRIINEANQKRIAPKE